MVLCLGEPLGRFLWCWLSFLVFISFSYLHFVVLCRFSSFDFQATLPYHRHSTLASQTSEGLHQLLALPRLLLITFSFSSTASAMVLSGHFLLMRFLPYVPSPTFYPAFIKLSLGAGSSSLKFAGLHTDLRNTDPAHLFVWFTVIHNLLYILNLYLYMSILQKFYLWWKLW